MQPFRNIRRAVSVGATVAVFGVVLSVAALSERGTPTDAAMSVSVAGMWAGSVSPHATLPPPAQLP